MDVPAILDWARARMADADDAPMERGYRLAHGIRVGELAVALAAREAPDVAPAELFRVAGVLHDIGKAGYRGPEPHGPRGVAIVRAEAAQWFAPDELDRVCFMVEHHYDRPFSRWFDDRPRPSWPVEVLLLQDADLLDHCGANYFWLSIHHAAGRSQSAASFLQANDDETCLRYGAGWRRETRRSLNFEESRREFDRRQAVCDAFFRQFSIDLRGALTPPSP
jgi:hypothetical protein